MIHVLNYEENIIEDLSFKQDAIYEAEHKLNVQDMMETFDFTVASKIAGNLRDRNRIIIQDHMGIYREFIVEMITDLEDGTTEIQSNASYLNDITTAKPLKPKKFTKEMPTVILDYILADTGWEVADDSEVPGDFTIEWDKVIDRAEALKILQEETDMRLTYFIEVSGNKVNKRYVSIKKVDPLFNGEEIVYEDNLIGLKREIDFSEVATALLGVGPEESDGNGKEKKRLYVEVVDDKAQEQFGLPQRYIWDYYEVPTESDEKVTEKLLRQRTKKELDERKKASVVYEVSSNAINAQVGDMIRVKDEHIVPEIYLEAEIIEINYDLLSKTKEYKFGILREFTRDQVYRQFNKFREELEKRLKDAVSNTDSIISERLEEELKYVERYIEKSPTPPLNPKEGQLWLDTSHDGVAVLKRYENGEWIKSSVDNVKDIGGMTREETMYEALKERFVRNEVDYSEVFKRHGALVSEKHYHYVDEDTKNDLTNRYNALQQSYDDFKIAFNNINAEQPTIGLITTAISRAIEFEARLKEYNDSYYVARKLFDEVIGVLQSQYSEEKFNEAMEEVAGAIGGTFDGTNIIADVPNQEELKQLNEDIKAYLNGEIETLDGKLGKQIETVINQAKDEFSVAIDSVDNKVTGLNDELDTVSQEVSKNNAFIGLLENEIKLKADSRTVKQMLDDELNAVKSSVQTNQAELQLLSNQISSKVEKSEYTTDINGITRDISNTKSEINQLSDSVNSKITSVEQKFDELNIENRNLVLKSDIPYNNSNYLIADYTLSKPMEVGKTYTITVKGNVENTDGGLAILRDNGKYFISSNVDKVADELYQVTFEADIDTFVTDNIRLYNYPPSSRINADIEWIKLEEGNVATDWSPAPEDVREHGNILTKHETEIEQNKLGLNTKVGYTEMNGTNKTLEKLLTEFSQTSSGFNFRIDSNGMIQDLTFDRNRFKLNSNLIEFNDGDVIIKDGVTTIKDAFIEKLKSTIITSEQVRIAYNNISNSLQITPGGLETTIEGSLASRLNSFGHHFYFKGDYIGAIGTGNLSNYPNVRGLSMTLDSYGEYLAFGYRSGNVDADDPAQVALLWSKGSGGYSRGFHFNEDIKIKHNKVIETLWLRPSNYNTVGERISFSSGQIGGVQGVNLRYNSPSGSGIHLSHNKVIVHANNSSISGVGDLQVSFDSRSYYVQSLITYHRTYSYASNLYITSNGVIGRTTSARKYKLSIENQFKDDNKQLEHSKKILELDPKTWFDKSETEIYAEELKTGKKQTDDKFTLKRHFGMIADEFEEIGMKELVSYDDKGEVEGLAYDRIPVHHNVLIKDLYKENKKLKSDIEELNNKINKIMEMV